MIKGAGKIAGAFLLHAESLCLSTGGNTLLAKEALFHVFLLCCLEKELVGALGLL